MKFRHLIKLPFLLLVIQLQSCSDESTLTPRLDNTTIQQEQPLQPGTSLEPPIIVTDPTTVAIFLNTGKFGNDIRVQNQPEQVGELSFSGPLSGNARYKYKLGDHFEFMAGSYFVGNDGRITVTLSNSSTPGLPPFKMILQCRQVSDTYKYLTIEQYFNKPAEITIFSLSVSYFYTYHIPTIKKRLMNTPFKMGSYTRPGTSQSRIFVISFSDAGKVKWREIDGTFPGVYTIGNEVIQVTIDMGAMGLRSFQMRLVEQNGGDFIQWEIISTKGFDYLHLDGGGGWKMDKPPIALENTFWKSLDGNNGQYTFGKITPLNGDSGRFTYTPDTDQPQNSQPGVYHLDTECPFITRIELENGCRIFFVRPGNHSDIDGGHATIYANEWCNDNDATVTRHYGFKGNI
jgi:hypothetical protein